MSRPARPHRRTRRLDWVAAHHLALGGLFATSFLLAAARVAALA